MRKLDGIAAALVLIGALNWGLVAIAEFDLVATVFGLDFGETNAASRVVYGLVGIAAVYAIGSLLAGRRRPAGARAMASTSMLALVAAAAVVAGGFASTASARPAAEADIVTTASSAGQFTTLTKLLRRAGLAGALKQPGPFTVFAPTDAAFKKVPSRTLDALLRNRAKLKAVLLYHVVSGEVTSDEVVELRRARTLNGKSVRIRTAGANVFVNDSKVTKVDVMATNGVIHVVNRVLIPPAR